MRWDSASVPMRCPRCLPPIRPRVNRRDGRRIGWEPTAVYVGYLLTAPYEGWKRPPLACPDCDSPLEEVPCAD